MINLGGVIGSYSVDRNMAELGTVVLSRQQVNSWKPNQSDLVLVSIRDNRELSLHENVKSRYKDVLELVFDDVLEKSPWADRTVFSLQDADTLWQFFKKHQDQPMIIHCHAGISRSAAVAICRAFHDRSTKLLNYLFDDKFCPNPTVVRKFLEHAETKEHRSLFMRWDKI